MTRAPGCRGFTLVEALIAMTLLMLAITGIVQVLTLSRAANDAARRATQATLMAMDKMEQLRALPIDDPALALSPPGTLRNDIDGYADAPVAGYARRWSIAPLPANPAGAVVVQVRVVCRTAPAEARLVTIKARKGN